MRLHRRPHRRQERWHLQHQRRFLQRPGEQLPAGLRRLRLHPLDQRQRIRRHLQHQRQSLHRLGGQLYGLVWRKLAEHAHRNEV